MSKITVNYRVTVNMGNYESVQYGLGAEIEVPENIKLGEIKKALDKELEKEIKKKVIELRKKGREVLGLDTDREY